MSDVKVSTGAGPDPGRPPTTVVVVDDHPVVLAGVRAWFEAAGIVVAAAGAEPSIAFAGDGRRADVVVIDLYLGDWRPSAAAAAWDDIAALVGDGRRVVVYTMRDDRETALRCLEAGCATFLTKAEGEEHLVAAVLAAAQDRPYVPPALAGAMSANEAPDRPRLTEREREVLLAWFQCESKQLVAARCNLSPRTVEGYIDRVRVRYARVGRSAPTKASLVARALQDGLIELEDL